MLDISFASAEIPAGNITHVQDHWTASPQATPSIDGALGIPIRDQYWLFFWEAIWLSEAESALARSSTF
jgi:hypothetical protein